MGRARNVFVGFLLLVAAMDARATHSAPAAADAARPPVAAEKPHVREIHGRTLTDPFFWLRERDNPDVVAHLHAENAYTEAVTGHLNDFAARLYEEMVGRIKQTDLSVPYKDNGYFYYSRTVEGQSYPIFCRRQGSMDAPEEIMLDVNELAKGRPTLFIRPMGVSPDNTILAYGEDPTGGRNITIRFKNLRTGALLPDTIEHATGDLTWFNDSRTFVYSTRDETMRSSKVFRSSLGADHSKAELLLSETDERFNVLASRTLSDRYLLLSSTSYQSGEVRFLSADDPKGEFRVIEPRRQGVEYSVDHHEGQFLILHNDGATNFTLVAAPVNSPGRANWKTIVPHREDVHLTGITAFKDYWIIQERVGGLPTMRVRRLADGQEHTIQFPEESYSVFPVANAEYDAGTLRLSYASFITPISTFDYDLASRKFTLLKEQAVLGGYDRTQYVSTRFMAKAPDGAEVPVTVVHRKGLKLDGTNPTLLYSYGSYGINTEVAFFVNNISLLDRGMVYAIAQIRGGSEKGRTWYEQGKMMNKLNTFTDFIAAAETLVAKGYTKPDRLVIRGGSAGGLLVGGVVNMRPDLFRAALAHVPFVDVINTMLDEELPATVEEFEQWGNPKVKAEFDYMMTYSPYDNVAKKAYPAILATTGLHDSQVPYWEPAKWVQRLRLNSTSGQPILMKIDMQSAHGGASGRYERIKDEAFYCAWILDQVGLAK
jgi:oligopeptidase B